MNFIASSNELVVLESHYWMVTCATNHSMQKKETNENVQKKQEQVKNKRSEMKQNAEPISSIELVCLVLTLILFLLFACLWECWILFC